MPVDDLVDASWLDNEEDISWLEPVVKTPVVASARTDIKITPIPVKLSDEQEFYVKVLQATNWKQDEALSQVLLRFRTAVSVDQISTWWEDEFFCAVVEQRKKSTFAKKGITKAQVLLDARRATDSALTKQPILYKGEPTGYYERNPTAALKGVELMGKELGMFKGEDNTKVTVGIQIIDWTRPRGDTLDGVAEDVTV